MNYFFYTLVYLFTFFNLQAQNCLPDSTFRDSSAGVYPKPISPTNPNGGIKKKACINKPFEFIFTVVVPDSVTVPIYPTPIALEKVAIDTINAISNLPKGITYKCNPPNCVYNKNTFGCLILSGIATTDNIPGDFKPIIKLILTINLGFPVPYATEYPGDAFPGEYILTLQSEVDCASATNQDLRKTNYWYPNPGKGILYAESKDVHSIKIYDLQGICIFSTNKMLDKLDLTALNKTGLYYIQWIENNQILNQKLLLVP
ncbi:MAG: T9SS type A sorting domain-containing protein [Saprospiraceae bacterium]